MGQDEKASVERWGIPRPEINNLSQLRTQRQMGRRYLPFLKTLADFDIACEVGFHELSGKPLTVKQLMLLEIAPAVTVFRRLERLCSFGVILRTRSPRDGRVHELRLAPAVHRLFAMYVRAETESAADDGPHLIQLRADTARERVASTSSAE